jgi:cystathionine beta-lyase family protein involved in aluminum resistance
MKKLIVAILGVLIISAILFYPITEQADQLDNTILLQYNRVGGFAGFDDRIIIYQDGSVDYNGVKTFISDEDLQKLKQTIESKDYTIRRQSLISKYREPQCCDLLSEVILINVEGKTISINPGNQVIYTIITQIQQDNWLGY